MNSNCSHYVYRIKHPKQGLPVLKGFHASLRKPWYAIDEKRALPKPLLSPHVLSATRCLPTIHKDWGARIMWR